MQVNITSRNHALSDFLRDYIQKRINKLEKYVHGEGAIHVVLEREEDGPQVVDITLHAWHKVMHTREEGDKVRDCIDKAVAKIEAQMRKHKEKTTEKRP
ncbi:MAG TPA: ribosome-associated translation inhibitor RaiA [bacterium]|nr:ribosome-associated translation inhibitor RaiA [bacterium]HOL96705.1 ribosome-associated translation inhibitor RaiA [bacterium]